MRCERPPILDERYAIQSVLGRGGMGLVLSAHDLATGREVAVKVPHPELVHDRNAIERLRREARLGRLVVHPNLARVRDAGCSREGIAYVVFEHLSGPTLGRFLAVTKLRSAALAVAIVRDVADALAALHAHGIVHRDVKADNVLLVGGRAVLLDLGIARPLGDPESWVTAPNVAVGTPGSMAPEQCAGRTTKASDVYALGLLLRAILGEELGAHPHLAEWTERATAHDPGARPEDALAARIALDRATSAMRSTDEEAIEAARAELGALPPSDAGDEVPRTVSAQTPRDDRPSWRRRLQRIFGDRLTDREELDLVDSLIGLALARGPILMTMHQASAIVGEALGAQAFVDQTERDPAFAELRCTLAPEIRGDRALVPIAPRGRLVSVMRIEAADRITLGSDRGRKILRAIRDALTLAWELATDGPAPLPEWYLGFAVPAPIEPTTRRAA
jgi:serine/threonine protein kinase